MKKIIIIMVKKAIIIFLVWLFMLIVFSWYKLYIHETTKARDVYFISKINEISENIQNGNESKVSIIDQKCIYLNLLDKEKFIIWTRLTHKSFIKEYWEYYIINEWINKNIEKNNLENYLKSNCKNL